MSYGTSATSDRDTMHKALDEAFAAVEAQPTETGDERHDQLVAARHAIDALAAAVGRPADQIHVSVTGHANPGHGPVEGWAHEFITVTVSARPRPVTASNQEE